MVEERAKTQKRRNANANASAADSTRLPTDKIRLRAKTGTPNRGSSGPFSREYKNGSPKRRAGEVSERVWYGMV